MAALLLLERHTPLERAVFVLRDVFDLGMADIAAVVERSEATGASSAPSAPPGSCWRSITNPAELGHLGPTGDLQEVLALRREQRRRRRGG